MESENISFETHDTKCFCCDVYRKDAVCSALEYLFWCTVGWVGIFCKAEISVLKPNTLTFRLLECSVRICSRVYRIEVDVESLLQNGTNVSAQRGTV